MQSTKPYFIRALHEWCVDQGFTPYLAVAVDETTRVPMEFVKNGEIVFNVGLEATNQLLIDNDAISFQGRFGGKVFPVLIPVGRVSAIYARENSEGMAFEITESNIEEPSAPTRLGRGLASVDMNTDANTESSGQAPTQTQVDRAETSKPSSGDSPAPAPTRPTLTRIK
ncbi:MAG TPA: ClpXP protease specificity-enhancing factor [Rugosibacter sp.]|nr:ClpXP protease specificity-enhancing factor [Rugosibacter sp.]MDD3380130.1 ClpXP protease specificity-enhancing factor [Rugosibacter sp.]HPB90197.1 ClpXP protease specificity-enhancing factor [Rugosibacter sp.]HQN46919.1 ClpXP protease specificity-enhancing factor [Rugosibacter sp.]HQQ35853.1 ClpXP protease specificity-enhancing factor [Rugosibacter sp.]